jgi:histidinol dehydrogenase
VRVLYVKQAGYAQAVQAVHRTNLQDSPDTEAVVRQIIADVRERGDAVLLELARKFDCPALTHLEVTATEWDDACRQVDAETRRAVEQAAANITAFHERQKRGSWLETGNGTVVGQTLRALDRVGLYVPGGTAAYPSSVLMCAIPAKVAGVPELIMCTPSSASRPDGTLVPLVLYAARVAGVSRVFKTGGAQAVAAMALGTETIPGVDKIVGPGNTYVNLAKKQLWGVVDMDMLAGPSEVCVVADETANPVFVAADMLTQAEHDTEAAAFLITPSERLAQAVLTELAEQTARLPRRAILHRSLEENSTIVVTETLAQAFDLANACAPEHLALMVRDPFAALGNIRNAGAVLLGDYTPQTLGDYLAGPSHTLPTSGTARFASPLNVDTFLKKASFIYYTADALRQVAPTLLHFADAEGFEAHAEAVRARQSAQTPESDT